jgi:hypothetical protein
VSPSALADSPENRATTPAAAVRRCPELDH